MKMVYTNESHFLVNNVKNLIEGQEIETFLKNEFVQGGVGEIPAIVTVWLINLMERLVEFDMLNAALN